MEQNTIQLMIDIQYRVAKPVIKYLLIFYTVGFYIPFIYICFVITYDFDLKN